MTEEERPDAAFVEQVREMTISTITHLRLAYEVNWQLVYQPNLVLNETDATNIVTCLSVYAFHIGIFDTFEGTTHDAEVLFNDLVVYAVAAIILSGRARDSTYIGTIVTRNLEKINAIQIITKSLEDGQKAGRRFLAQGHIQVGDSED